MTPHRTATLVDALWPSSTNTLTKQIVLAVAGSLLLTLSAKIQVPFWPVPMTMQTFAIMVLAAAFGARLGTATVLLYLAEGAIGLPVFAGTPAKGIGLAYMMGPTGGYLVGFLAAAMLIGWLAERGWDRSIVRLGAAMFAGHVLVFAFGYAWLATLIGAEKAWTFGVAPFYAATLFKTALAALVLPAAWQLVRKG
ncbi:MAG: biotin transporter BioY [Hyphomicrobiaceae bacterium]|nr:biotin transporter BioY [Hyphomicrobiaceae bacterium]